MAGKLPGIPLGLVRPFYQVVVFNRAAATKINLKNETAQALSSRKRPNSKFNVIYAEQKNHLQYLHVQHTTKPAWVRGTTKYRNVENDEVLLYVTGTHVFLHSNCSALLEILTGSFSESLSKVAAGDIEKVLASRAPEIRSLGMQNLNAPGRTAPEGKIHFARNAAYTLSPVRDAMFGLRHAFAVERGAPGQKSKPFGCSTAKRKIWGTWEEDADAFIQECERVSADLSGLDPGKRPWPLAAPIATAPKDLSPIAFYADYNDPKRGIVWLEDDSGDYSSDWSCYLNNDNSAHFDITMSDGKLVGFDLEITATDGKVRLDYPQNAGERKVKLCDVDGELENRRPHDLVEFLNKEEAFTVVFNHGIAFRSGNLWKSELLEDPFDKARVDISWTGTDLLRESFDSQRSDTISDAIMRFLVKEAWPEVVICDDGANEVADLIVIGNGRMVLVHAKYSSDPKPGLRAGDLQTVIAQCVKNLHFFQWDAVEKSVGRFQERVRPEFTPSRGLEKILRDACEGQRTIREAWIVQPGLSAGRLKAAPDNKIHALLNYAESACWPSNIEFHLFCSP